MNEKIKEMILKFGNENKTDFLKYYDEKLTVWDHFDLEINNNQKLENHPALNKLVSDVTNMLFKDPENYIVDLGDHVSPYNRKSLSEIGKDENLNYQLSLKSIKNYAEKSIKISALNYMFFQKEDPFFKLKSNKSFSTETDIKCEHCDKTLYLDINCADEKITIRNEDPSYNCKELPSKIKFELKIQSKKIVIVNDSTHLINSERKDEYKHSINSNYGKIRECQSFLEKNCPYFHLGNLASIEKIQRGFKISSDYSESAIENMSLDLFGVFIWDHDMFYKYYEEIKDKFNDEDENIDDILGSICVLELCSDHIEVSYDSINKIVLLNEI